MGFAPTEPELSDSEAEMERVDAELLQRAEETLRDTQAAEAEHQRLQPIVDRVLADHARQRAETARVLARAARVEEEMSARVAALLLQP